MKRPLRILVANTPEEASRDFSVEQGEFPQPFELRRFAWRNDAAALAAACREVDAVLTDYVPFGADVLRQMQGCRLISIAATGHDAVDIPAAASAGISVCCVAEYCTDEVADHTMLLLLALSRRLLQYHQQVQEQGSWAWDRVTGIQRLAGQTMGIIGFGRIGQAVARRAMSFGLKIIAFDPLLAAELWPAGVQQAPLDDLLAEADIISLHASLQPGQRPVLDRASFQLMQRRPLLLNVARGALIDEKALVQALDEGLIAGAGLDVLSAEPPVLGKHPLMGRENVILTPHVAFYSDTALNQNRVISARNIRHFFAGRFDQVFRLVHHAQDVR